MYRRGHEISDVHEDEYVIDEWSFPLEDGVIEYRSIIFDPSDKDAKSGKHVIIDAEELINLKNKTPA